MKGLLVCFEGLDGSGKRTQAEMLEERLQKSGIATAFYSYPDYSSVYGKRIDDFLKKRVEIGVEELSMLFLADMVKDSGKIVADIGSGKIVILDRYFFSTIAYQSAGGSDYGRMKRIEDAVGLPRPDIVFYMSIDARASSDRKSLQKGELDKLESDMPYLSKVAGFYDRMLDEGYGAREWAKIDASKDKDSIHEKIAAMVMKAIGH
ncbi:MAG: dTMP kinase [Candidatus Micrarchaeota archaeon]|nr:dTMP kinase [Candidatus Micrarchaeota archaeon]